MYLTKAAIRYALSCPDLLSLPTEVIPHLLLDAESTPGLEPVDCSITIFCYPSTRAPWANYTELLLQETFHFWNAHLCIMPSPSLECLSHLPNLLLSCQNPVIHDSAQKRFRLFIHLLIQPLFPQAVCLLDKTRWEMLRQRRAWGTLWLNEQLLPSINLECN